MKLNKLTEDERRVIIQKSTEPPFSGKYDNFWDKGKYLCKYCNSPLFSSKAKFDAGCGWPSFDESFQNSVELVPDTDGVRTEVRCKNCKGHLGHIFRGEKFTTKNTRYCINSISLKFVNSND